MYSKKTVLSLAILSAMSSLAHSYPMSGHIIGRDLNFPGMGSIGHVAMATGDNVFQPTNHVIEATPGPGIQFNTVDNFKNASPYWGSRYGLVSNPNQMYNGLVMGKLQSFWCPRYTTSYQYTIGQGYFDAMDDHPIPTRCGVWRCDTFVSYVITVAGYDLLSRIVLPYVTYDLFPYIGEHGKKGLSEERKNYVTINDIDQEFINMSAEDINALSLEEKTRLIFVGEGKESPAHKNKEWELIEDKKLLPIMRMTLIDMRAMDKEALDNFIEIYQRENDKEVKNGLTCGLMFNYQNQWNEVNESGGIVKLKKFYADALQSEPAQEASDCIVRGYVDTHDDSDIKNNIELINKHLDIIGDKPRLGLELEIIRKSPSLQGTILNKAINGLQSKSNPELEDMFVFLMGKGFVNSISAQNKLLLRSFVNNIKSRHKNLKGINANSLDDYFIKQTDIDIKELESKI